MHSAYHSAMQRAGIVGFLVALAGTCAIVASWPAPPAAADIATPRNFVSAIRCTSLNEADVTFVIPGTFDLNNKLAEQPRQIWIDLSLQDNGFAPGTFIGAGPFSITQPSPHRLFAWHNIVRNRTHSYRLNALMANGQWREVGRGTFRTPDCAPLTALFCEVGADGTSAGTATARFEVGPQSFGPERPGREFWIDLSIFGNPRNPDLDNGFPPGTFIGAGPFPATGATFDWHGLLSATRHYSRVNVLHGGPPLIGSSDQWEQSLGSRFTTLDCRDLPSLVAPL